MSNYHAFLIRLWRETDAHPWHAELQFPATNERHSFATPELLYSFLDELMRSSTATLPPIPPAAPEQRRDHLA